MFIYSVICFCSSLKAFTFFLRIENICISIQRIAIAITRNNKSDFEINFKANTPLDLSKLLATESI